MHKRIICLIIILLFCSILITGCLEGYMHVTFNLDGTADIDFELMASSTMGLLESEGMDFFSEIKSDMIKDGFTLEDHATENMKGFKAKKHVEELEELTELTFMGDMEKPELTIDEGLFFSEYTFSHNMKLKFPGMGDEGDALAQLMNPDIKFILTFPFDPISHDADLVLDDGKTLQWNIGSEGSNPVNVKVKVPNILIISLIIIGIIIVILVIVLVVIKMRKK